MIVGGERRGVLSTAQIALAQHSFVVGFLPFMLYTNTAPLPLPAQPSLAQRLLDRMNFRRRHALHHECLVAGLGIHSSEDRYLVSEYCQNKQTILDGLPRKTEPSPKCLEIELLVNVRSFILSFSFLLWKVSMLSRTQLIKSLHDLQQKSLTSAAPTQTHTRKLT